MSMIRWEPFRELFALRDAMDRMFDERTGGRPMQYQVAGERHCDLPIDVYVTEEEVVITASLPGVAPEDVEITLEGENLAIKGEIRGPLDNVDYVLQERACGKFHRNLRLNLPVDANKAEASFDKGILTLIIPKQDEAKPKTIKVSAR